MLDTIEHLDNGSNYKRQQDFENVVHNPMITGPLHQLVMKILNMPSLHLLLGVIDKLLKELGKNLFPSQGKEKGEEWVEEFLKNNRIIRKKKQGKQALEGNQCSLFLEKVDALELSLMEEGGEAVIFGLPYVTVIRAFKKVVDSCFGVQLEDGYKEAIDYFAKVYKDLGITTTPKVKYKNL